MDSLYRRGGFSSDREGAEHLLGLYERNVAPLTAVAAKPKHRSRSR